MEPGFRPAFFWRDSDNAGAGQVDAHPFAGHRRVQRGFLEELWASGIAHIWYALSGPNGAPLEFHDLGNQWGWRAASSHASSVPHRMIFEECMRTSTSMVFGAADSGQQWAAHKNEITEANLRPNHVDIWTSCNSCALEPQKSTRIRLFVVAS